MKITTLAQLISQMESNGNPFAVRFETEHHTRTEFVLGMQTLCNCTLSTARVLCCMSWGEFQIMGDELIALGLSVSPFVYMGDSSMQLDFFRRYILADHIEITLNDILTNTKKRELFARLYNGPGNVQVYSQRLLDVYKENQA